MKIRGKLENWEKIKNWGKLKIGKYWKSENKMGKRGKNENQEKTENRYSRKKLWIIVLLIYLNRTVPRSGSASKL